MTSDEELIERLRRTLRAEAAAVRPNPQEYPLAPAGQPGRVLPFRAGWPLAAAAVAVAAAAAAAVILALVLPGGGGHRVGVLTPAGSHPSSTAPAAVPPTTVVTATTPLAPATTVAAPGTTVAAPGSTAPPAVLAVPAGFEPLSVTWVSAYEGWALGSWSCQPGIRCLGVARTFDGGRTWRQGGAPGSKFVSGETASIRFADGMDGWVYSNDAAGDSLLWSTHDGGDTWGLVPSASYGSGQIAAMEASGGYVRLAVMVPPDVRFYSTPVWNDMWRLTGAAVPIGAGPVPSTQLVLQRTSGWALQDDRTVVGGAILGGGAWTSWKSPPCANANGPGTLAASDATHLVAICTEGVWGPAGQPGAAPDSQWLFTSADGGSTFQAAGPLPGNYVAGDAVTTSGPGTVVAGAVSQSGSSIALIATFDGGRSWQPVYTAGGTRWVDVGFTNSLQGVAISLSGSGSSLLMTRDGGHSWAPVNFSATG